MAKRPVRPEAEPKAGPKATRAPRARTPKSRSNGEATFPPANEDDIRVRAYQRYLERGGGHGRDFDDWLAAEKDLKVAHN